MRPSGTPPTSRERERRPSARPDWEPERWVREEERPRPHQAKRTRKGVSDRRRGGLSPAIRRELVGSATTSPGRLERRLVQAIAAYEADRYGEAASTLRSLVAAAPNSPSVRELYGLTLYRQGKWREAIRQLDRYVDLTGSFDQHPVLADCHRALDHDDRVKELWDDLRRASPSSEVVGEGRMVVAGLMADRGDVKGAISLMRRARLDVRQPRPHHLRQLYLLADLYERAGDIPRAREIFRRVMKLDPELTDAPERLAGLG